MKGKGDAMRNYLLPDKGNFYKANLHSHSALSDGHFSAEQMKKEYQKKDIPY